MDSVGISDAKDQPLVSIVMPMKNAEAFLPDCLESILSQTYSNWELICIDDGSTDGSAQLLEGYASNNPRIRPIAQNSEGTGAARNRGMGLARGKYIIFLDSDDIFLPDLLKTTVDASERADADVALFGGRSFDSDTGEMSAKMEFINTSLAPIGVFSRNDCLDTLFRISTPCTWTKLFKRTFLEEHGLRFEEIPYTEDLSFTRSALALADRIIALDADLVRYRRNIGTSMEDKKDEKPLCFLKALQTLFHTLEANSLFPLLFNTYADQVLSTTRYCLSSAATDKARTEILCALEDDFFRSLDLLGHSKPWYATSHGFECAKYLEAALRQKRTITAERNSATVLPRLLSERKSHHEISPAITTIIPVHNAAAYVAETLDSVLSQSAIELEVICIDDGSRDESLAILLEFAEKDPRVTVFAQENQGLSSTRNAGIRLARGKYVHFLDSDDKLAPGTYQSLLHRAIRDDLDILLFDASAFFEDEESLNKHSSYLTYYTRSKEYPACTSGATLLDEMAANGDYKPSACLYLLKRDFIMQAELLFHPAILHEDNGFTFAALIESERASHMQKAFYQRRVHESSIMTREKAFSNAYGYYACSIDMMHALFRASLSNHLSPSQTALELIFATQRNARHDFASLPQYESGALTAFDADAKKAFLVAMDTNYLSERARGKIELEEKKASKAQRTIERQTASISRLQADIEKTTNDAARFEKGMTEYRNETARLKKELARTKESNSYKIGRAATAPLRKLKALCKRIKEAAKIKG